MAVTLRDKWALAECVRLSLSHAGRNFDDRGPDNLGDFAAIREPHVLVSQYVVSQYVVSQYVELKQQQR
ncbi:MAG: hypothetical protein ACT4TC_24645 [Myxococcaceae bacterium]